MTDMNDAVVQWFAACEDITQMGPFPSDVLAWKALELTKELQKVQRRKHPLGAYVWPEAVKR